jgi:hypothetical protein
MVDRVDDSFTPFSARGDIARGDPAAHARGFEAGTGRIRYGLVMAGSAFLVLRRGRLVNYG